MGLPKSYFYFENYSDKIILYEKKNDANNRYARIGIN